jgi:hypothetical protein
MQVRETCEHILFCNHAGRADALLQSINLLDKWMGESGTDPTLRECIVEYAYGRGGQSMSSIAWGGMPADGPVSRQNRMEAVYGGYGPQRNEGDPGDV